MIMKNNQTNNDYVVKGVKSYPIVKFLSFVIFTIY